MQDLVYYGCTMIAVQKWNVNISLLSTLNRIQPAWACYNYYIHVHVHVHVYLKSVYLLLLHVNVSLLCIGTFIV